MASLRLQTLFTLLIIQSLLFVNHTVKCDHHDTDEEDNLFQGINSYRASLNLTALVKNQNAECFADEIADQFRNQPCTNTTGSNTVPGSEPQFSNYPNLLAKCHLNVTTTRDGSVLPACVPNLDPMLVLSNFTQSQYSGSLNDSSFTGIGVGSEDNWIVVVLTKSTSDGGFVADTPAGSASKVGRAGHLLFLLISFFLWT